MPTKNLRYGRIKVRSGDPVPLLKTAPFTEGDFSFTRALTVIQVKDRGKLSHLRRGDEEPVPFSFSAKFTDRTLRRTLEEFVWDGQAETITGLVPQVSNDVTLSYAYEQDSLQPASGEAIGTKLPNGQVPSADDEFAELTGALDQEGETTDVRPGAFKVRPGAADTDMNVVYDAVGRSTKDQGTSDKKTFEILLEKLAVHDEAVVEEVYLLTDAYVETAEQAEGDEFDTLSFNGVAYVTKARVAGTLTAKIHLAEASDAVALTDSLSAVLI